MGECHFKGTGNDFSCPELMEREMGQEPAIPLGMVLEPCGLQRNRTEGQPRWLGIRRGGRRGAGQTAGLQRAEKEKQKGGRREHASKHCRILEPSLL